MSKHEDITSRVVKLASDLSSLPEEVVELSLKCFELATLSILYQESHELSEVETYISGPIMIDAIDTTHIITGVSDEFFEKVQSTMVNGRDYLGEEVISKFTEDLLESYISESMVGGEYSDE